MELPIPTPAEPTPPVRSLAPVCPRCQADLAVTERTVRREGRLRALLCPALTCGYKRIVPT